MTCLVRIVLPAHLRTLAQVQGEVVVEVEGQPSTASVLTALEALHPVLRGTMRDQTTLQRRPFVRFFGCSEDLSHEPVDAPLPAPIADGREPFLVIGAMAGG